MVMCRMMIRLKIRLVLYDLQNNKHCVGGADDPPPMPKSDNRLNMSRVIFRSRECTLISEEILVFIEIEEQLGLFLVCERIGS
jgi:hypothetical protein